jgi:hypothetical protein
MWEKELYFLRFLNEAPTNLNTLFSLLKPPPEGRGELVSSDSSDDAFPGSLEAVLFQGGPRQGLLQSPEEKKVGRCQIW